MSKPKKTLQDVLREVEQRPTTPEYDLALIEFLELSDAQQKSVLFRQIVDLGSQLNWIIAELRK